jgi:MOSC domain-containing protein YiiM
MEHPSTADLEAGLDYIRNSPADDGRVELIVCRPAVDEREVLDEAKLDATEGLVGDSWLGRGNPRTPDGNADPRAQLNVMNARSAALVAGADDRRPLAGDQLYVDLDLSYDNVPPGTRLEIGSAIIEISEKPHRGCAKFSARFGPDALSFVNSEVGRSLNLRGVNARVVTGGVIRTGDPVRKVTE